MENSLYLFIYMCVYINLYYRFYLSSIRPFYPFLLPVHAFVRLETFCFGYQIVTHRQTSIQWIIVEIGVYFWENKFYETGEKLENAQIIVGIYLVKKKYCILNSYLHE